MIPVAGESTSPDPIRSFVMSRSSDLFSSSFPSSVQIPLRRTDAFFRCRSNGVQALRFGFKRLELPFGFFERQTRCSSFGQQHLLTLVSSRCSLVFIAYATGVGRSAGNFQPRGGERCLEIMEPIFCFDGESSLRPFPSKRPVIRCVYWQVIALRIPRRQPPPGTFRFCPRGRQARRSRPQLGACRKANPGDWRGLLGCCFRGDGLLPFVEGS